MLIEKKNLARIRIKAAGDGGILLPLGLFPSPERQLLVEELGSEGFGRKSELLCPFYDSAANGCSVWNQRPAVCTSYFCKSDRGAEGLEFWGDVESYLNHFEWALANEVYQRMGFTEDDLEMCKATMISEEGDEERELFLRSAWGDWFEKKEELFEKALATAQSISAVEVGSLLTQEFLALEEKIKRAASEGQTQP